MRLIIAEKPSVARDIAQVLGANRGCTGYWEGRKELVSWCVGHLAGLAEPQSYDPRYDKWALSDLPIVPEHYRFALRPGREKQFAVLKELMNRNDVTEVVNACDAGREGELIFRSIYTLAGCRKKVLRLWISSMEDEAIREGFRQLRPGNEFDGLYRAALCRTEADWLVGINATRFFSLLYHNKLTVGRVMSPTLALLVQRQREIESFEPEIFYAAQLDCGFLAYTERMKERAEAERIGAECRGKNAEVKSVERKEKCENAPALYDLTTLQRDANRQLGFTAQQTLDYLQSLYEKKLCTYPRTDSRYLTDDMEDMVPVLLSTATVVCGLPRPERFNCAQVCNSKKVSDHHAIVPTVSVEKADISSLPLGEQQILKLVVKAVLRAVCEPFRYAETIVTLECAGYRFTAKGKTVLDPGWKQYEQMEKSTELPELNEKQTLSVSNSTVREGKTTAPKAFTEDTLLHAMETAGGDVLENAERRGIGTPATRAGILEKLVAFGFAQRQQAHKRVILTPSSLGIALIGLLPEQLRSPQLTAEWEQRLKTIEHGEMETEVFMTGITEMLLDLMKEYQPVRNADALFHTTVGCCPRCGNQVVEKPRGYFCVNEDCRFALWKDSRFFTAKRKNLTEQMVVQLLRGESITLNGCHSEKTGKSYDAVVTLSDDGEKTEFKMDFRKEGRRK